MNKKEKIFNIGYFGIGKYKGGSNIKSYITWYNMLARCYSEKEQLRCAESYIGCYVVEEWFNYQVFAEWYENNYIDGFALDKDILIKGNKVYSPETCCFVPQEINSLFTKATKRRGIFPIGVRITKSNNYQARIIKFSKHVTLGTYGTIEQAFNMYKINKEFYNLQVANKWKNFITEKTYQAIINYKVEITD